MTSNLGELQHKDEYYTPKHLLQAVAPFVPRDKSIWMPFYGDGSVGRYMRELGFDDVHHEPSEDFFTTAPPDASKDTIVVDNPPFSLKREVFERLVSLDLPFMLIVPLATISYQYTRDILGESFQIIIPRKRMNFRDPTRARGGKKQQPSFASVWLCHKMNFDRDISFI